MPRLDVGQVGQVVLGEVDGVVGQVVVPALDAEVEHERGAGELLAADLAVAPSPAQVVGDEAGHGASEVGIDDQGVGMVDPRSRSHAHRSPALEEDLLDLILERDGRAQLLGRARPSPPRPCRTRPADDRRHTRIRGTRGSRRGSGN